MSVVFVSCVIARNPFTAGKELLERNNNLPYNKSFSTPLAIRSHLLEAYEVRNLRLNYQIIQAIYLLGHAHVSELHNWEDVTEPEQAAPPLAGLGLLQERERD